jgi:putative tricarboxylic transport membrane protein
VSGTSTRADRIAGLAVAALGLAVGAEATTFDVLFRTDPVGPKLLPLVVAAIFVASGVFLAARPGQGAPWPPGPVLVRMAGAVAAFGAYAALIGPLGFVVSTTATVSALSMLFGGPWKKAVAAALTLSVVLWYLFVWVLGLLLPLGWVWEALWTR